MSIKVGLQLFSVREAMQKDFLGTLEKVAKMGYKYVEISTHNAGAGGSFGGEVTSKDLKEQLDKVGLKVITSHVFPLENVNWDELIKYNIEIGSEGIVWPMGLFKNKEEVLVLAHKLDDIGKKCRENGLDFYYHNHFQEFQKFDGKYIMDILLENTDPKNVKVELDTYWALRGGVDPIEYMEKLGSRCGLIHQKDLTASANPINLFNAIEGEITIEKMMGFMTPENFTEIGIGVMDIKGIIAKAKEIGAAKYIIIEQDMTAKTELESVELSLKNLQELNK